MSSWISGTYILYWHFPHCWGPLLCDTAITLKRAAQWLPTLSIAWPAGSLHGPQALILFTFVGLLEPWSACPGDGQAKLLHLSTALGLLWNFLIGSLDPLILDPLTALGCLPCLPEKAQVRLCVSPVSRGGREKERTEG